VSSSESNADLAVQQLKVTVAYSDNRFGVEQSIAIAQVRATLAIADALDRLAGARARE
jgi:hypothetical protein